jgi:hypothetical protein
MVAFTYPELPTKSMVPQKVWSGICSSDNKMQLRSLHAIAPSLSAGTARSQRASTGRSTLAARDIIDGTGPSSNMEGLVSVHRRRAVGRSMQTPAVHQVTLNTLSGPSTDHACFSQAAVELTAIRCVSSNLPHRPLSSLVRISLLAQASAEYSSGTAEPHKNYGDHCEKDRVSANSETLVHGDIKHFRRRSGDWI